MTSVTSHNSYLFNISSIKPFNDVYKIYDVTNARRIGSGGFGKVYLIRERDTNKKYAAKYQKLANSKLKELVSVTFDNTLLTYDSFRSGLRQCSSESCRRGRGLWT